MFYYVYILQSAKTGRYYIGYTGDVQKRLYRHNAGHSKSTKSYCPWDLKYVERYKTRSEAMIREREIKSKKSRKYIEYLIEDWSPGERPESIREGQGFETPHFYAWHTDCQ